MPDIVHRDSARTNTNTREIRCAIYTRKSSDEGLDQEFNSLHAQREACEAYVASQRHEGWVALSTAYDDGGFSGGSLQRPALERLLTDIKTGRVDVVVVYKIDRLTRSLFDFAKIVEILEAADASFVSVTQSFNTTTSMGRLTLNVLLSFAQFEREVAGERIRDKIAASRAKGMFMGGNVPIGYDVEDHALVINEHEAGLVQSVFEACSNGLSIVDLKHDLDRNGVRTKARKSSGGKPFTKGHIYFILRNPVYIGKTRHKGKVHDGRHQAIISQDLWEAVQKRLDANLRNRGSRSGGQSPNLLLGLVFDSHGRRYTASHAKKGNRRYRYYSLGRGVPDSDPKILRNIPARKLETIVVEAIQDKLGNVERLRAWLETLDANPLDQAALIRQAQIVSTTLCVDGSPAVRATVRGVIRQIEIHETEVVIEVEPKSMIAALGWPDRSMTNISGDAASTSWTIRIPFMLAKTKRHRRVIITSEATAARPDPDPTMVNAVLRARRWFDSLLNGAASSITELAKSESTNRAWISSQLPLAFLAPDITEAILDGRQPRTMTMKDLSAIASKSFDWAEQRAAFESAIGD